MKVFHILNLGAGIQSTTLYLMFLTGELTPKIDYAIFIDTGEEPAPVYKNLTWLKSLNGPPILVRSVASINNDFKQGRTSAGQHFAMIPAYIAEKPGEPKGMVRRQCTKQKLDMLERTIREEIVGLEPGQWFPTDEIMVFQYIGISAEEIDRALRIRARFADLRWAKPIFPLVKREMTRVDCEIWLKKFRVPHEVPRSACVCCPYRSNAEWRWLRDSDPNGFQRAIDVDEALRAGADMKQKFYVHCSCMPLRQAVLDTGNNPNRFFARECEGVCGV